MPRARAFRLCFVPSHALPFCGTPYPGAGQDPAELEARLEGAKEESAVVGVGAGVLWRDLRRNIPLAAREANPWGAELSPADAERAARGRRDFWPSFWFANIFMNTVPWTPLILPLLLRVVPKRHIVPPQLDAAQDPRASRLLAVRVLRERKQQAAAAAAWGDDGPPADPPETR